jgi:hypothetical protein
MYSFRQIYLYLFLFLISGICNYVLQSLIISDNLLINYFQDQMGYDRILQMIDTQKKWAWLNYALLPVIYLVKFSLITFWILCGTIIAGYNTNFKSIFKVVLVAEFVWLLPSLILLVWFGLIDTSYTFNDVQYFAPLSLLNLFDASQLDSWLIFPLKSLNLFEVIYLLVLALGIKKIMKKDYDSALKFTLPVYGSALVVWILFVTFLSINLGA